MAHVFLHNDYVRGTWREGSYNEYSEVHVMEGYGNGAVLIYGYTMGT